MYYNRDMRDVTRTVTCITSALAPGAAPSPDVIHAAKALGRLAHREDRIVYMAADDKAARYIGEEADTLLFSPALHIKEHTELYRLRDPFAAGLVCTGQPADGYLRPLLGSASSVVVLGDYEQALPEIIDMVAPGMLLGIVTEADLDTVRRFVEGLALGRTMVIEVAPTPELIWKRLFA